MIIRATIHNLKRSENNAVLVDFPIRDYEKTYSELSALGIRS
jgi:hypothetical protein